MAAVISLYGCLCSLSMVTLQCFGIATWLTLRRCYPAKQLKLHHAGGWERSGQVLKGLLLPTRKLRGRRAAQAQDPHFSTVLGTGNPQQWG